MEENTIMHRKRVGITSTLSKRAGSEHAEDLSLTDE